MGTWLPASVVLKVAVGLEETDEDGFLRADVAPNQEVDGVLTPAPEVDPEIDIADVVATLRVAVGLLSFATPP